MVFDMLTACVQRPHRIDGGCHLSHIYGYAFPVQLSRTGNLGKDTCLKTGAFGRAFVLMA